MNNLIKRLSINNYNRDNSFKSFTYFINYNSNNNYNNIKCFYTTINNKDESINKKKKSTIASKFPSTMLGLKKKVTKNLLMKQYKIEEIEKKVEDLLIKQEESTTATTTTTSIDNNLFLGFGLNNLKNDIFLEKEKQIKQQEIEKEKQIKRRLKIDEIKNEYSNQMKIEIENEQRLKMYNRFKSIQESKLKSRLLNKKKSITLSMVGKNKFEPFEKSHNIKELDEIIKKFKTQDDILLFQERIDLHLYSFQLHLKNNLFKSQFPMIYNNLSSLKLKEKDKEIIEKLVDNENFYDVIALARTYHQEQFKQGNLVYHYAFEYLKKNKKLWRLFQLLENPDFNFQLDPLDFSEMVQVFLELDQIHSAEMLTSNMQSFVQDFYPDVFIHFFEYFNRQPDATVDSVTSEFLSTFKQFSFNQTQFMQFQKPRIEEKKKQFLKEQQELKQEINQNDKLQEQQENEDEEKKENNLPVNESEFIKKLVKDDELSGVPVRNIEMYKSILIHCYKNGYIEFAENLEDFMEREGVTLDLETFNGKLKFQATEGIFITEDSLNSDKYITIIEKQQDKKKKKKNKLSNQQKQQQQFKGNSQTFLAILYHSLIIHQDVETSLISLESLKKKWSFKLNTFIINQLIFGLSRLNKIDTALKYYKLIPSSVNAIYSKTMNQSVLLYTMSYYNHSYNDLISFINEINNIDGNNTFILDKPTLDLIIYGYLLDNKFKQDQNTKYQQQILDNNNDNSIKTHTNMIDNLIQVLNYLKNQNLISKLDKESTDFIFSRLVLLKNQYNIKPSPNEFKLLKQLIK